MSKIEHIILVIFENRSFDHLLGWMSHPRHGGNSAIEGLVGAVDPATDELTEARYRNPAIGQTFRPFFAAKDEFGVDLPHGREEVTRQMAFTNVTNTFSMKGFAASYYHVNQGLAGPFAAKPDCMRMLSPAAAPVTAFLAQNFKVCDHWFTPIPAGTHPNRVMALAGETQIDDNGVLIPDHDLLFDWAQRNDIPWRVYSDGFSFMMTMRSSTVLAQRSHYRDFDLFARDYQFDAEFPSITLIEPSYLDDPFASRPNDNHPPLAVDAGEAFLLQIYKTFFGTPLAQERFKKTALVIYYDEHGGLFDHVPPLTVRTPGRDPDRPSWPAFTTTGPRVPAIIVSPLVDPGVFKGNLDHTSVLRFLADCFTPGKFYSSAVDARHRTASAQLRSVADAIDRSTPRTLPVPPDFGSFATVTFPAARPVVTEGQTVFLNARVAAHTSHHDELMDSQPWSFFAFPGQSESVVRATRATPEAGADVTFRRSARLATILKPAHRRREARKTVRRPARRRRAKGRSR